MCYNMDEHWRHYATWTQIQKDTHCTIPLIWGSRVVKFTDRKENGSYQGAVAREDRSYCLVSTRVSVGKIEFTAMWTDLMPLNWTQKMVKMANFVMYIVSHF